MDGQQYQVLLAKLRAARSDAQRVDGLRDAGNEWQENVSSSLDKLADVVAALLAEAGPTKHAQAVKEAMGETPAPRMALDKISEEQANEMREDERRSVLRDVAKNPDPRD